MSERAKATTSVSLLFRLTDATSGKAKAGVDVTTLKLQYARPLEAPSTATALTLLAAATTAWTAFGARELDATNSPGVYRVDAPDAAFATGAAGVDEVTLTVAGTGIEPSSRLVDLMALNARDGVRAGLSALPNVAAGANGGLPLGDGSGRVTPAPLSIDVPTLSNNLATLLVRGYLTSTGTTTPASADTWITGGTYNGLPYYKSLATNLYAWNNTAGWTISAVVGTNGSAYWTTGSTATVIGPYTLQGTATGTPVVALHLPQTDLTQVNGVGPVALGGNVNLAAPDSDVLQSGTAQAGGATTITLSASANAVTSDYYKGERIVLNGGTGSGQARIIVGYVASTRVATVNRAWAVNPDATTTYAVKAAEATPLDANLAVTVGTVTPNVTVGGYASGQDPATLVLDVAASGHNTAGTIGAKVNAAGTASDPWATTLPGSYGANTAGNILGNNLNAAITTRQPSGNVTVGGYAANQDPATLVLDVLASGHVGANTIGAKINAAGSAGDPWTTLLPGAYATGTAGYLLGHPLTVGTNTDKAGYSLAAAGLDAVPIEAGVNARQALAVVSAVIAGHSAGLNTGTATFYAIANPGTLRLTASGLDTTGNRPVVTPSLPA